MPTEHVRRKAQRCSVTNSELPLTSCERRRSISPRMFRCASADSWQQCSRWSREVLAKDASCPPRDVLGALEAKPQEELVGQVWTCFKFILLRVHNEVVMRLGAPVVQDNIRRRCADQETSFSFGGEYVRLKAVL